MLSLHSGKKVAIIEPEKGDKKAVKKYIYVKDDNGDNDIDTTPTQKMIIFEKFLKLDKKLRASEIDLLKSKYRGMKVDIPDKLIRKYEDVVEDVEKHTKTFLDYGKDVSLFPVVDDESYKIYISGMTNSGKSFFINEFLKHNKPVGNVFLFSPVVEDKSLSGVKNMIQLWIENIEAEIGRSFEVEDIPMDTVVIFDDIESFKKPLNKVYMNLRDALLERGRHRRISVLTISHNPMQGNITKASIRESQYYVLFPKFNARDTKAILTTYVGLGSEDINKILNMDTRWCFVKKTCPKVAIGSHAVMILN